MTVSASPAMRNCCRRPRSSSPSAKAAVRRCSSRRVLAMCSRMVCSCACTCSTKNVAACVFTLLPSSFLASLEGAESSASFMLSALNAASLSRASHSNTSACRAIRPSSSATRARRAAFSASVSDQAPVASVSRRALSASSLLRLATSRPCSSTNACKAAPSSSPPATRPRSDNLVRQSARSSCSCLTCSCNARFSFSDSIKTAEMSPRDIFARASSVSSHCTRRDADSFIRRLICSCCCRSLAVRFAFSWFAAFP
mmetsp:Transcript_928/g.2020  ORF Transcript_928/g.2020 Transcript_928/m.2020 type:complete len:256 (+) Transcript_928:280-1047(+)